MPTAYSDSHDAVVPCAFKPLGVKQQLWSRINVNVSLKKSHLSNHVGVQCLLGPLHIVGEPRNISVTRGLTKVKLFYKMYFQIIFY